MTRLSLLTCLAVLIVTASAAWAGRPAPHRAVLNSPARSTIARGGIVNRGGSVSRDWNRGSNWNRSGNWNGLGRNRSGNWNGNWRRHHHGRTRVVFVSSFGYPYWGSAYPYYWYPYAYGYYPYGANYYGTAQPEYGYEGGGSSSVVVEVQRQLAREGYYRGAVDGVMGSRTRYAIRAYKRAHGLRADGEIDEQLLGTLRRR